MKKKGKLSTEPRYKLNAICPYYTMFPLEFPMAILKRKPRGAVVLDPFCGRGTTNYAAKACAHVSYGIDASPVAVAISKAKIASTTFEEVMSLADCLLEVATDYEVPLGEFWNWAYHPETLDRICRLRTGLIREGNSDAASMLRGLMLGCLHGPLAKNILNTGYFSNQMPRTFSSKPDYSVSFWKKRDMAPVYIDIKKPLRKKGECIFAHSVRPREEESSRIWLGDSCDVGTYKDVQLPVNLVITSPPYYGMRTYIQDQWLRYWFLGGPDKVTYDNNDQMSHFSPQDFSRSLSLVWDNIAGVSSRDLKMVIRFGAVPSRKADPDKILRESFDFSGACWDIYRTRNIGDASLGRRQSIAMGEKSSSTAVMEKDYFVRIVN